MWMRHSEKVLPVNTTCTVHDYEINTALAEIHEVNMCPILLCHSIYRIDMLFFFLICAFDRLQLKFKGNRMSLKTTSKMVPFPQQKWNWIVHKCSILPCLENTSRHYFLFLHISLAYLKQLCGFYRIYRLSLRGFGNRFTSMMGKFCQGDSYKVWP